MRFGVLQCAAGAGLVESFAWPPGTEARAVDAAELRVAELGAVVVAGACAPEQAEAIARFATDGGAVLGVGAGCGALCAAGLLQGSVVAASPRPPGERFCVVEGRPTPFTHAIPAARHLFLPHALVEGRYVHPDVDALEAEARVVLRYCCADGEVDATANPEDSMNNIAGVCDAAGNVVGLLPRPAVGSSGTGGEWGALFASVRGWRGARPGRV